MNRQIIKKPMTFKIRSFIVIYLFFLAVLYSCSSRWLYHHFNSYHQHTTSSITLDESRIPNKEKYKTGSGGDSRINRLGNNQSSIIEQRLQLSSSHDSLHKSIDNNSKLKPLNHPAAADKNDGDSKKPVKKTKKKKKKRATRKKPTTPPDDEYASLRPHPHRGALDANGQYGYVADVYAAKKRMASITAAAPNGNSSSFLPLTDEERNATVCDRPLGRGDEKHAADMLVTKIEIDGVDDPSVPPVEERREGERYDAEKAGRRREGRAPRILCAIYTILSHRPRIQAIGEMWGHRCDGFLAASMETVPEIGAVNITHEGIENYANMWQKTRSIWAYIYDHYLDDFDFFHLGGDDMYLIVENLRNYLWGFESYNDDPLFLGMKVSRDGDYYLSGAPGYTINRHALKIFVERALPKCKTHAVATAEDRFFSDCMRRLGVVGNDTTDARNEQRYIHIPPVFAFDGPGPRDKYNQQIFEYWASQHGGPVKRGRDVISSQVVAMHWFKGVEKMKRHHAILYRSCPRGTPLGDSMAAIT